MSTKNRTIHRNAAAVVAVAFQKETDEALSFILVSLITIGLAAAELQARAETFVLPPLEEAASEELGWNAEDYEAAAQQLMFAVQKKRQNIPGRAPRGGSAHNVGGRRYYSDGGSSHNVGGRTYYSDGGSSHNVGGRTYYSNGGSSHSVGGRTYYSDGRSSHQVGGRTYYSDGSSCHEVGGREYCS